MSAEPPSFDDNSSFTIIEKNSGLPELKPMAKVYHYNDIKPRCEPCDMEFENNAGLASHVTTSKKHTSNIKDRQKGLYDGDILYLRLPKNGEWVHDPKLPGFVNSSKLKLPDTHKLLKIIGEKGIPDPKNPNDRVQHLEVIAIRKGEDEE